MESSSASHAFDFPLQINQAEIESLGVRESFTWAPQALWLLCGFIWIFYALVRDIPQLARNTVLFNAGATLLAALGIGYEMRRRNRQTVLYPLSGPNRPLPREHVQVQLFTRTNGPGALGFLWLDRGGMQVTAAHAAPDGNSRGGNV